MTANKRSRASAENAKSATISATTVKFLADLKQASASRSLLERSLFSMLDKSESLKRIVMTVKNFVDISGSKDLPVLAEAKPLQAKNLLCTHSITINGKKCYGHEEKRTPTVLEKLKVEAGLTNLWRIRIAQKNNEIYIPVGIACSQEPGLITANVDLAVKLCTEVTAFLYESDLFVLFGADFAHEKIKKYTVFIQQANSGQLGIIDPRNPNAY